MDHLEAGREHEAVDSRCGLHCVTCTWKESHGCRGCIESMGNPFHGACGIAICCQDKGHAHCGECDVIPCEKLYGYSYLDPEHGDRPQGTRVMDCRRWAAQEGRAWQNVLLTSAGWFRMDGTPIEAIRDRFLSMLGKPAAEVKVLFIPVAAVDPEAMRMADLCLKELVDTGIAWRNITPYMLDGTLPADTLLSHDVIYIPGGDTAHLLRRLKETGMDAVIKRMVYRNKVYVGISAGGLVATPNIGGAFEAETAGLALLNAYLDVHRPAFAVSETEGGLPRIALTDGHALAVDWQGYTVIEG